MSPELLLEHFHSIADSPNAIPKLRCFILDLAVRGKLVSQDPKDEPANLLINRISDKKKEMLKAGEIKAKKKKAETHNYTPLSPIPDCWQWTSLNEVGLINPRNKAPDEKMASFVPMPLISAEYGVAHQSEQRLWKDIKSGYTHFAEGDVVLAKITPCFENGKSTVMRNLHGKIGAGTTELHVVRPLFVNPDYILIFLKSLMFIANGIPIMTGTAGQKRVPSNYFSLSPFPLPPLTEQHRIVAKVDELMALCDELEAAQETREKRRDKLNVSSLSRISGESDSEAFKSHVRFHLDNFDKFTMRPDQIPDLRQTILDLAVRGKLVPQEPKDEVLHDLPVETPFDIPPSWGWHQLGSLGVCKTGKTPPTNKAENYGVGFPFIGPGQITERGRFNPPEKTITSFGLENSTVANPQDILMVCIGGSIGKAAICLEKIGFNQQINSIELTRDLPEFLYLALTSGYFQNQVRAKATGTATPIINKGKWEKICVPIPPIAEQHRIVAKVDELMALCDELENNLKEKEEISARATVSLLSNALNGST